MVPDVMDLYRKKRSEQKVTASNGGERKWDENEQCLSHPMDTSDAARADGLVGRVG
jgi:hypothetical protein